MSDIEEHELRDIADLLKQRDVRYEYLAALRQTQAHPDGQVLIGSGLLLELAVTLAVWRRSHVRAQQEAAQASSDRDEFQRVAEAQSERASMLEGELRAAGLLTERLKIRSLEMSVRGHADATAALPS